MDSRLRVRLQKIEKQIEVVYESESKFLTLEAAEEHVKAQLIAKADGSSQAARENAAEATPEWSDFSRSLAIAKAAFHRERHLLELKQSAFQAEYLSFKVESDAISRQGKVG